MEPAVGPQGTVTEAAGPAAPAAQTAGPPSLQAAAAAGLNGAREQPEQSPHQAEQQQGQQAVDVRPLRASADTSAAAEEPADEIDDISDSDIEQLQSKTVATAAGRRQKAPARAVQRQGKASRGSSPDEAVGGKGGSSSDLSADDISGSDDDAVDGEDKQPQQRRSTRPQRQQQQQQQQPATGRARRAAAAEGVTETPGQEQEQQQGLRRSTRTRRAARGSSPDDSPEAAPAARPRRAAAAAAKEATAAALAAEAAPATWATNLVDDSDLGSPDTSDAEEAGGHTPGSNTPSREDDSDSEGSLGGEGADNDLDSWGPEGGNRQRQRRQQQPTRQQPRRGRGVRAAVVDDSSEDSDSQAADDAGPPDADGSDEDGGDQPLDLNAFRYNAQQTKAAPAAAAAAGGGARRGQAKRRGSGGSSGGSSDGGGEEDDAAAVAAALQAESELLRDVCDVSEFTPQELQKLPRGHDVDKLLAARYEDDGGVKVLAKLVGRPYRAAVWLPATVVESKRLMLLRNFLGRHAGGEVDNDWADNNNINPLWYKVDRVVSEYKHGREAPQYLVKWCGLEYSDSTWEQEEELCRDGVGKVALARYKRWSTPPRSRPAASKRPRQELLDEKLLPDFKNGRKLRDYQEESLHWMINNYRGQIVHGRWKPRNCILGDEMGLGKTAQSIAVMSWLKQYAGASAPCMVVAPLTTLGHWKREIETWTDLNVVLYAGGAEDRKLIREYEFLYPRHRTYGPRFNVLLSSYETVLKDKTELKKLQFEALIVDEAHRLKNSKSATRLALQELSVRWLLMLSGTPVQNNMKELQGLMSLLDKDVYGDEADFLEQYGSDTPNLEQIRALQAALAPVLLRRMKEDVEDLPEKEEVVVWCELTQEQRRYYRALYSQQIGALLGGGSNKNLPGMRNLAMELRKLCCHPFLCDGLEDDMTLKWAADHAAGKTPQERDIENYTRASGKMLLLHKLLPKLKAEGRQVLVFSQFKMMLDVIEDYLTACGHRFERIDGDTKQSERQAAIDRFMAVKDRQRSKTPGGSKTPCSSRGTSPSPDGNPPHDATGTAAAAAADKPGAGTSREPSPAAAGAGGGDEDGGAAADGPFVFLLSTRAGGQGITLTSADTVIIYDSDWNPQNDLQAMARCHRIGQEKEVTVYRLVSKNTYEQQLFETASRKYGLDEAILGFAGAGDNPENDAARIEQLLRLGAHAILQGAGEGAAGGAGGGEAAGEDKGFAAEDIEHILLGRSEKRQLGSRKGNTFSIAHFGDGGGELEPEPEQEEVEVAPKDAKTFWTELLPEAVADHAAALATKKEPVVLGPRRRRQVDYREANMGARDDASSSNFTAGGSDGADDEGDAQGPARGAKGTKRPADAEADPQGSGSKKHKKKAEDTTHDPELGRPVQPWKAVQVEVVRDALLRFGVDRMDKVAALCQAQGLMLRQSDEIRQLSSALVLTLGEMARLAPALHQQEKAAKEAAMAAAAAGAAGQPGSSIASKNASVQYVNGMRDGLVKAGLEGKLPKSCSKALLSLDAVRRMCRAPAGLQQQLDDHHKVHLAMVAAGLGHSSSKGSPPAAAAAGTGATSSAQQQEAATTPVKPQPAAAAAAAGDGDGGAATPGGDGSKRVWVSPRVLLRGSKGLPPWWKRDHDDQLLQGSYHHGFLSSSKLTAIVESILQDPAHGFTGKVGLDPVEVVKEQAALAAPPPPLPAPTPSPPPAAAAAAAADGSTPAVVPAPAPQPPPPVPVDPEKMAAAQRVKQQLQQEHAGIELLRPVDWRKLVAAVVQRLKRVRTALLDPNYVEPPTPSKPIVFTRPLNLSTTPAAAGAGGGAAAAAAAGAGSAQQRLQLTPASDGGVMYKGKKVIGGGLPVGTAAAAAGGPARTPPSGQGPMPVVLSPVQQQQLLLQHQRMVAQHNAATAYNAARTVAALAAVNAAQIAQLQVKKRQAQEQLNSGVNKKPTGSNNPSPVGNQQQPAPRLAPAAAAAAAAQSRQNQLQQQRMLLQQQQARQQPQQQPEVVELLDDDSSDDDLPAPPPARSKPSMSTPAAGAGAVGAPAQPPPSSGMVVRRMPAGADLSQEQSLDEPTGAEAAGETPAGTISSSGKQHMQQLLGSTQPRADGSTESGAACSKAADHPVYGTPAGAAPTAAVGTKRKQGKDDTKQRKLNEFFAVSK